ncbi:MAG: hypothetical protein V4469_02740 [Patescibacteria group bacterium]
MKKTLKSNFEKIILPILLVAIFVLGANLLYAWTAPAGTPPAVDAPTPINVGPNTQIKAGGLGVDGNFLVSGNAVFTGKITIADGTQGAGKYLTSDKDGIASWKPLP